MKRVAILTGSRAEYGLLRPTLDALHADRRVEPSLVVCGMHLDPAFGATVSEIESDGQAIAARVPIAVASDVARSFGPLLATGVAGLTEALGRLAPDLLLVLGDRHEALAGALSAVGLGVPVAHLHGGELSLGSLDDASRHCITQLADLHLVAARPYAERVCQLGARPERVFVVGAAGVEAIRTLEPLTPAALAAALGLPRLDRPLIPVTLHPESRDPDAAADLGREVADGLLRVLGSAGTVIITLPNDDPGNAPLRAVLRAFSAAHSNVHAFDSLGQHRYLSLLSQADAMVGNSSSAILEAPSFGLPAVNVGDRQRGRIMAANLLAVAGTAEAVAAGLRRALAPAWRASVRQQPSPFGDGHVARRVVEVLALAPAAATLRRREFFDLPDGPWRAQLNLGRVA